MLSSGVSESRRQELVSPGDVIGFFNFRKNGTVYPIMLHYDGRPALQADNPRVFPLLNQAMGDAWPALVRQYDLTQPENALILDALCRRILEQERLWQLGIAGRLRESMQSIGTFFFGGQQEEREGNALYGNEL